MAFRFVSKCPHERFNDESVAFIRTLVEYQINTQISESFQVPILEKFTAVKIKDSTRFQVPPNLKEVYPGSDGAASEAGIHIQFEFDVRSGKLSDLHISDALHQDATNAHHTIDQIQPGSLLLRDLGYFSTEVLEGIQKAKAGKEARKKGRMFK